MNTEIAQEHQKYSHFILCNFAHARYFLTQPKGTRYADKKTCSEFRRNGGRKTNDFHVAAQRRTDCIGYSQLIESDYEQPRFVQMTPAQSREERRNRIFIFFSMCAHFYFGSITASA